ncbi:TRAP transporter substrate-binding protein DctP [Castellaniella caeni]|nr:TRAP transporter substrate-binding protein DctP [Castellaniella caeni]
MNTSIFKKALLAGFASLLLSGTALAENWKFAIEEIPGSIMDSYAQAFKKHVESKTNGEVTVSVYPLGALGTPTEVAEQTADGVIQFSNLSVGNLGTLVPESQILLLPYVMPSDSQQADRILADSPTLNQGLAKFFAAKGLKLGALYSEGPMYWTTRKIVRTPADLSNLKVRVMVSPLLLKAYEDLGASPTPISFGEVYGALQLGQIDAQVNPIPAIEEMKFYEVTDYLINFGELNLVTAVMASEDWYQALPANRKQLVDETLAEVKAEMPAIVKRFNEERWAAIQKAKPQVKMIELTADERAVFRQRSAKTQAAVSGLVGKQGSELLQSLVAEIGN